jgi:hypothetical protein
MIPGFSREVDSRELSDHEVNSVTSAHIDRTNTYMALYAPKLMHLLQAQKIP